MARPAQYSIDQIVASAAKVVAKRGPAGATVARIAQTIGAPTGSIYHRFASRDVLLGEVWLRTVAGFQRDVIEQLAAPDAKMAGLAAVRSVPQWVRDRPQEARILLLYRSEDFLERNWPKSMSTRAKKLRVQMAEALRDFCQRLLGRADAASLRIVAFALAEAPLAALRQHVRDADPPPPIVDDLIDTTYRAALSLAGVRW
jgi:AcrR family transcriptional regulator